MRHRFAAVAAALLALLAFTGTALADNCFNASRPAGGLSTNPADFSAPVFRGNWVWLPSVGAPLAAWGFGVPSNYLNSLAPLQAAARWHLAPGEHAVL